MGAEQTVEATEAAAKHIASLRLIAIFDGYYSQPFLLESVQVQLNHLARTAWELVPRPTVTADIEGDFAVIKVE